MKNIVCSPPKWLEILFTVWVLLGMTACKKLVQVTPPITSTSQSNVYSTDATAAAVLTGIYTAMSSGSLPSGGMLSMSLFPGLSADELTLYGGVTTLAYIGYYQNNLTSTTVDQGATDFWSVIYPLLFDANSAIQGLAGATALTPAVKQQLTGEAEFVRGFLYFYLVNLYGDVPLVSGTNYKTNELFARTPKAQVWSQIIADLKAAEGLLSDSYLASDAMTAAVQRTRPVKSAASALLARAYLYNQNWDSAKIEATAVINNTSLFSLDSLNGVFTMSSPEAIWQLQPVLAGINTQEARLFILPATGPDPFTYFVYIDSAFLGNFEANDGRATNWLASVQAGGINYYFSYKYKVATPDAPVTEYEVVLRLAEQYLIRAEARAELGDIAGALADLDAIRNRAGLPNYAGSTDAQSILNAIMHERQVELFTEWGHRWLDLKRTTAVDSVMPAAATQKGGTWNSNAQLYPVPLTEIQSDPNLIQNPGY